MIQIRRSHERGHIDMGWLNTFHTFSFGEYHDPTQIHFGDLRVINDDIVAPDVGFDPHPHRDMEIISYVLEGSLKHEDSMGNGSVIPAGDVQYMSAGSGVVHSEKNPSKTDPVRLLQIWIFPNVKGAQPRYDQRAFPADQKRGRLCEIASPDGRAGSIAIRQDARVYASILGEGQSVRWEQAPGRRTLIQVARGALMVGDHQLEQGDTARWVDGPPIELKGGDGEAEFVAFDLA